jgi:hypothetical protein
MSELRIALVVEGVTDAVIIESALRALIPTTFTLTILQPEATRPTSGTGWGGVLRWCLDFSMRGCHSFETDPTLPDFDLFIIHVDADVAEFKYLDVSREIDELANQRQWPALPIVLPCPPPDHAVDAMRTCLLAWAGLIEPGPDTVLCVPSKASEAWLVAALFDRGHALVRNLECSLDLERRLRGLPKAERVKKHTLDYRDHSQRITDAWASVCEQCSQAERFSLDVIARMPSTQ